MFKNRSVVYLLATICIFAVLTSLIYFQFLDSYVVRILIIASINTIIALGLNLILGFTGQLALGHAGFMAIGAYSTSIAIMQYHVPTIPAVVVGGLFASIFGFIIGFPSLRLKGDYLAIVTLGFGEIIRVIMINLESLTGGAAGLKDIPSISDNIFFADTISFVWVSIFLILTIIVLYNIIKSSHGRAIISIREDEIAASSMGINVFYYKMFSFVLSAFFAGLGGGLYALVSNYLNPTSFNFMKSVEFVVIVVLGGMGSIAGTIFSGFLLTGLQEYLRVLQDYRLVIYPLLLILMMLFSPSGLAGIFNTYIRSAIKKWKRNGVK